MDFQAGIALCLDQIALDFYNRDPAVLATNRPPKAEESFYVIAEGDKKDIPAQIPAVESAPWKAKGLAAIWSHSRGPRHEQMLQREYEQLHKKLGS